MHVLILEIWVATSSLSIGTLKGCGPKGCALLCLRPLDQTIHTVRAWLIECLSIVSYVCVVQSER